MTFKHLILILALSCPAAAQTGVCIGNGAVPYFTGSAFACQAGNTSGTKVFQEDSGGNPSWVSGGGGVAAGVLGEAAIYTATSANVGASPLYLDASQFAGATADAKINACITAAIAAGNNNVCDARALGGAQTIAAQINVGDHAQDPVTLLLPKKGVWNVTINDGASCGIMQFSHSAVIGTNTGDMHMFYLNTSSALSMGAMWCNEAQATATTGYSYVRAEGFAMTNIGGATMTLGAAMVVNGVADNSRFSDITVYNFTKSAMAVIGSCCATTFTNLTLDGGQTATAPTLVIKNTLLCPSSCTGADNEGVSFINLSAGHPGATYANISMTSANASPGWWDSVRFYNLYTESNSTDTVTPLVQVDSALSVSFYGWSAQRLAGTTQYALKITNTVSSTISTDVTVSDFNWNAGGASSPVINDQINSVNISTNASAALPFYNNGTSYYSTVAANTFQGLNTAVAATVNWGQGTKPGSATTAITEYAPTSVTSYFLAKPGAAATGFPYWTNSAGTVTESIQNTLTYSAPTLTISSATNGNAVLALSGNTSGAATFTAPTVAGTASNPIVASNVLNIPSATAAGYSFTGNTTTGYSNTTTNLDMFSNNTSVLYANVSEVQTAAGIVLGWSSSAVGAHSANADTAFSRDSAGVVDLGNGNNANKSGSLNLANVTASTAVSGATYLTATKCSNAATPAVCAAAAAGVVAVPTGTNPTLTINTTAVTTASQIFLQIDESATISATTCNTTLSTLVQPVVTARVANTSFTIQIGAILATNPACVSYTIVN